MTLDLDHRALQGDLSIEKVCVRAAVAGADLLLLSPTASLKIPQIVEAIVKAVESGRLAEARLRDAAQAVRAVAR